MNVTKILKPVLTAFLLVVLVLTPMSFMLVNDTLAKFTLSETATSSARVAKWGMIITEEVSTGACIFTEEYYDDEEDYNKPEGTTLVAKSLNGSSEVAPGATNTFSITVEGKAEVKSKLTFNAKDCMLIGEWKDAHGLRYEPITWRVTRSSNGSEPYEILYRGTLGEFIELMNSTSKVFEANEAVKEVFTITWTWEVASKTDADYDERNQKDTALGLNGDMLDVQFTLLTSIRQIQ